MAMYILFEACVFLGSLRLVFFFRRRSSRISYAEMVILSVSTSIVASSTIASGLSFVGQNGPAQYMLSAFLVSGILHAVNWRSLASYKKFLTETLDRAVKASWSWKGLCVLVSIVPLLLAQLNPVGDTDSLNALSYMSDWALNQTNPYVFQSYYVAFWELSFMPSLVITEGVSMFWISSLKAMVLLFASVWVLSKTLGLSKNVSLLASVNSILFLSMWSFGSGISTIKTDPIFTAGIAMLVFVAVSVRKNGHLEAKDVLLLFLCMVFLTTKYSGVPILLAFVAAFVLINYRSIREALHQHKKTMALSMIVLMSATGHYYVYHIAEFGHPFYPLSELDDLHDTSIASSVTDVRLLEAIMSSAILFSAVLAVVTGVACSAVIIVCAVIRRGNMRDGLVLVFVSSFTAFLALFLPNLPYSAHAVPGDFAYIVGSLRYLWSAVILSQILLLVSLDRMRVTYKAQVVVIGSYALFNLFFLHSSVTYGLDNNHYLAMVGALVVPAVLIKMRGRLLRRTILVSAVFVAVIASPIYVESNTDVAFYWWQDSVVELYTSDPSTVVQVPAPQNYPIVPLYHPFSGNTMQNTLIFIPENELEDFMDGDKSKYDGKMVQYSDSIGIPREHRIRTAQMSSEYPEYVVQVTDPNIPNPERLTRTANILSSYGYEVLVLDDRQVLLKYPS